MLRFLVSAVVNAAAGYNHNVRPFSYIKIIVHHFGQTALAQYHRNVHAFVNGMRLNPDVNASAVFLGNNINIGGRRSLSRLSIGTQVKRSCRYLMEIRYLP